MKDRWWSGLLVAAVFVGGFVVGGRGRVPAQAPAPQVEAKQDAAAEAPIAIEAKREEATQQQATTGASIARARIKHPDGRVEDRETVDCTGAAAASGVERGGIDLFASPGARASQALRVNPAPVEVPKLDWSVAALGGVVGGDATAAVQVSRRLFGDVGVVVQAQRTITGQWGCLVGAEVRF